MKYISFAYYTDEYLGKDITTAEEFISICFRAEAFIDKITMGRIEEVSDDIKMTVCLICDELYKTDKSRGIKSESVDGYSVTLDTDKTDEKNLLSLAKLYLPSYLLYRGI